MESFSAKLLPPQPEASKAPKEFRITLKDMLGNLVPEGYDLAYEITFA